MCRKGTSFALKSIENMFRKLCVLTLLGSPFFAQAQDTATLGEVVISESRMQIPFNKNVRNIQIITREEIARLPVRSINEVLSFAAGVDLRQRGPFGSQADVSIDGGSFEQTLILLNGIKISDPQTAHHSLNIPIPLDAIERIEVLKGPAARVYGINALTGAINIVTKTPQSNGLDVNVYAGSSFKNKEAGDGSGIYGGGGAQVTGTIAKENHNHLFTLSKDSYNGQRYNSKSDNNRLFYQGRYQLHEKHRLDVTAGYTHNQFGANGFYASPIDKESYEVVETSVFSISSSHQLTDKFRLRARISDRYNEDDYRFYRDDLSRSRSLHYNNVLAGELHGSLQTAIGDFGIGVETRYESIQSSNIGDRKRNNQGFYAEYKTEAVKNLLLNIGTYVNYNSQYGWQAFPGIDMGYNITSRLKLGANIGTSQRIPSFTDLYLNQGSANIGNPDLVSENAFSYEFNVKYHTNDVQLQAGYFNRNISDFIDWVRETTDNPYQPFNLGDFKMQGWNIQIAQRINFGHQSSFRYRLSYNFLSPNEMQLPAGYNSKYQIESLKHQFLLNTNLQLGAWNVSLNNRYIKREINDGYYLMDIRASYQYKAVNIYTDLTNVFDQEYVETAAVPMPTRWLTLGVRYKFGK